MSHKQLSKWFARGSGHVIRYNNSDCLLFYWNGHNDGVARADYPTAKRYARNGVEHASLAALLRSIESEHATA